MFNVPHNVSSIILGYCWFWTCDTFFTVLCLSVFPCLILFLFTYMYQSNRRGGGSVRLHHFAPRRQEGGGGGGEDEAHSCLLIRHLVCRDSRGALPNLSYPRVKPKCKYMKRTDLSLIFKCALYKWLRDSFVLILWSDGLCRIGVPGSLGYPCGGETCPWRAPPATETSTAVCLRAYDLNGPPSTNIASAWCSMWRCSRPLYYICIYSILNWSHAEHLTCVYLCEWAMPKLPVYIYFLTCVIVRCSLFLQQQYDYHCLAKRFVEINFRNWLQEL